MLMPILIQFLLKKTVREREGKQSVFLKETDVADGCN